MAHFRISDFTDESKPREKLLNFGAEALSDAELLAILLGSGTRDRNVLELANDILRDNGGLSGLRKLVQEDFHRIKGIGPAKSASILSAIELGRRFSKSIRANEERQRITCKDDAYEYIHYQLEHLDHEELWILSLDTKNYVIREDRLYSGTINSSNIRIAEVFKRPLLLNAASFVLVHNHPSGDPTPSAADIVTTKNILAAGQLLNMPMTDHIIIGAGKYISVKDFIS